MGYDIRYVQVAAPDPDKVEELQADLKRKGSRPRLMAQYLEEDTVTTPKEALAEPESAATCNELTFADRHGGGTVATDAGSEPAHNVNWKKEV